MARGMAGNNTLPIADSTTWQKIFSSLTDGGPVREFTIESLDDSLANVQCLVIPCTEQGAYDTATPTPTTPTGNRICFPLKPGAKHSFVGVLNGGGTIREVWVRATGADAEIRYGVTAS